MEKDKYQKPEDPVYEDMSEAEIKELRGWDDADEEIEEDTSIDCGFADMQDYIDYING